MSTMSITVRTHPNLILHAQRPVGGRIAPEMELLVDHDVEGVVTKAAKSHMDNQDVTTEASALLHILGMDPITMYTPTPSGLLTSPPPPRVDSTVEAVVAVDTVTKASIRRRGSRKAVILKGDVLLCNYFMFV